MSGVAPVYYDRTGLASDAQGFVDNLKKLLKETAERVDSEFPYMLAP